MGEWGARIHDREGQGPGRGSFSSARVLFWGLASLPLLVLVANCGTTASEDPPQGSGTDGVLEPASTDSAATTTTGSGSGGASATSATSAATTGGEPDSSAAGAGNMGSDASTDPVDAADAGQDAEEPPDGDADTPVDSDPAVASDGCDAPAPGASIQVSTGTVVLSLPVYNEADAPAPLIIGFHATNNGLISLITDADGPFIDEYVIALPRSPSSGLGTWEVERKEVFEEIYEALRTQVCFDTRRVYAVGHASGGRYLQNTLCDTNDVFKPSELFRAVALQGAMDDRRCGSSRVFPTLFIHSVHDTVAQQLADEADNSGAEQMMREANECEAMGIARTGSCDSTNFECFDHESCTAPFRACVHDKKIYGTDDWPCFANDEIHEFFEELR